MDSLDATVVISDLRRLILLGKEWLQASDIVALYGITITHLEGLRKAREISFTRVGNSYLYNHDDLKAYFTRNKRLSRAQMEGMAARYEMRRKR